MKLKWIVLMILISFSVYQYSAPVSGDIDLELDLYNTVVEGVTVNFTSYGISLRSEFPVNDMFDISLRLSAGVMFDDFYPKLGKFEGEISYYIPNLPPSLVGIYLFGGYEYVPWLMNKPFVGFGYRPWGLGIKYMVPDSFSIFLDNILGTGVNLSYRFPFFVKLGYESVWKTLKFGFSIEKNLTDISSMRLTSNIKFGFFLPTQASFKLTAKPRSVNKGEDVEIKVERLSGNVPSGKIAVVFKNFKGSEKVLGFLSSGKISKFVLDLEESGEVLLKPLDKTVLLKYDKLLLNIEKRIELPKIAVLQGIVDGNSVYTFSRKLEIAVPGRFELYGIKRNGNKTSYLKISRDNDVIGLLIEKDDKTWAYNIRWLNRNIKVKYEKHDGYCIARFDIGSQGVKSYLRVSEYIGRKVMRFYEFSSISNYDGISRFIVPELSGDTKSELILKTSNGYELKRYQVDYKCEVKYKPKNETGVYVLFGNIQKGFNTFFRVQPDRILCNDKDTRMNPEEVKNCEIESLKIVIGNRHYWARSLIDIYDNLYILPKINFKTVNMEENEIGIAHYIGDYVYYSTLVKNEDVVPQEVNINPYDSVISTFKYSDKNIRVKFMVPSAMEILIDGEDFTFKNITSLSKGFHNVTIQTPESEFQFAILLSDESCKVFHNMFRASFKNNVCTIIEK